MDANEFWRLEASFFLTPKQGAAVASVSFGRGPTHLRGTRDDDRGVGHIA